MLKAKCGLGQVRACAGAGQRFLTVGVGLGLFSVGWMARARLPTVRNVTEFSYADFQKIWASVSEFVLIEGRDASGKPQGLCLLNVIEQYDYNRDGGYMRAKYLHCTDEYYTWWVANEMPANALHHFCRYGVLDCERRVGNAHNAIHVGRWCPLTRTEAQQVMNRWKAGDLPPMPVSVQRELAERSAVPKSMGRKPGHDRDEPDEREPLTRRKNARKAGPPKDVPTDFDSEEDDAEDDEEDAAGAGSATDKRQRTSVAKPVKPPKAKQVGQPTLDRVLDDEHTRPTSGKLAAQAEERLKSLREDLQLKKAATKGRQSPGALLAERAASVVKVRKKKKQKTSAEAQKVAKFLNKAVGRDSKLKEIKDEPDFGSASGSSSSGSSEEEDSGVGLGLVSGRSEKQQRKLRAISEANPGMLMLRGFEAMHEQLGTFYGGEEVTGDKAMAPAVLRYILTVAVPQMEGGVSDGRLRELRTLGQALDYLVVGHTGRAGDLLMQRTKAVLMALRDKSDVAAKWLELLPQASYSSATTPAEDHYARGLAVRAAKSDALLRKTAQGSR